MRSVAYLLGLSAGFGLALQIGMNSQLRRTLHGAYPAALVSFLVGTAALVLLMVVTRTPVP